MNATTQKLPQQDASQDPNDPTWTDTVIRRDGTLYQPMLVGDNGQRLPAEDAAKLTQIADPYAVRAGDRYYSGHGYWATVIADRVKGSRVTIRKDAGGAECTICPSLAVQDGGKFYRVS